MKRAWAMIESGVESGVRCDLRRGVMGSCCWRHAKRDEPICEVQECKVPNRRQNLQVVV